MTLGGGARFGLVAAALALCAPACLFALTGELRAEAPEVQPSAGCSCWDLDRADGFVGLALLTADQNWQQKWSATGAGPVGVDPVGSVGLGETAILLVFFANPLVREGQAEIACDLTILKPDGESTLFPPTKCYSGPVVGKVAALRLSEFGIELKVEASDPAGEWIFQVGVKDVGRDVRLPLEVRLAVTVSARAEP